MTDHLYALQEKLSTLEEIRGTYRELPRDDAGITAFLRFAYDNPSAQFDSVKRSASDRTHSERQRYAMAQRIFEQAHNIKQLPEAAVIEELRELRRTGKRPTLDAGLYEEAEDEGETFGERKHYATLIHALQAPLQGKQVFHYFTTYCGGSIFSPAFTLAEENERLSGRYGIPVKIYEPKESTPGRRGKL